MQGRKRAGPETRRAVGPGVSLAPSRQPTACELAIYELAILLEGFCEAGPDPRRVDLRDFRAHLRSQFGIAPNETDIAQAMAEEDGHALEE